MKSPRQSKSPFFVVEEFLSPLTCEEIVDDLELYVPDYDLQGKPLKVSKTHEASAAVVYDRLTQLIPTIETYYGVKYKGTEDILFEWFTAESKGSLLCENSSYLRKKWVKTRNNDLTALLFMSDYQPKVPFDNEYEVYGGKTEFPQHNFSFNPQRGTLVVFPSSPHFINITSEVYAGDLYQVRLHITTQAPFLYMPEAFPGDYKVWFKT